MAYVYALADTSVTNEHGVPFRLHKGEVWDADDPLVKHHPDIFSDTPVIARISRDQGWRLVEQATAVPGERRKR